MEQNEKRDERTKNEKRLDETIKRTKQTLENLRRRARYAETYREQVELRSRAFQWNTELRRLVANKYAKTGCFRKVTYADGTTKTWHEAR